MARYIDALLIVYFCFALIRGYKGGYFQGFMRLAGTVLGWAMAYLYTPFVSKNVGQVASLSWMGEIQASFINDWQITTASGGYYIESELPSTLMDCLRRHLSMLRLDGAQLIQLLQKTLNDFLVNLFCFACILFSIKLILAGITSIFSNKQALVVTKHSGWGLVLGLIDAGFSILLLSGVLIPFILIFDQLGLSAVFMQSRIIQFFSECFYYLLADWFLLA